MSHKITEEELLAKAIARLFQEACYHLPEDVTDALKQGREAEEAII